MGQSLTTWWISVAEADTRVVRVLTVLNRFVLIKRELHWLRTREPKEYEALISQLKEAVSDGDNRP